MTNAGTQLYKRNGYQAYTTPIDHMLSGLDVSIHYPVRKNPLMITADIQDLDISGMT